MSMSCNKYIVVAIVALTSAVVLARPGGMELPMAINQTICKTKVVYNRNSMRIPRVIKEIKCQDKPYAMCPKNNSEVPCCGALLEPNGPQFSCTEVFDYVTVNYTNKAALATMSVAVGCSCIQQAATSAGDA
uniref:Uncharacterized protein n=1 Tax=Heliothis virescens TaxID=7102 RepID=A0A2A4JZ16_HELVI